MKSIQDTISIMPGATPNGDMLTYEYGLRLDKESIAHVEAQIAMSRRLYNELVAQIRTTTNAQQAFVIEKAGDEALQIKSRIEELTTNFKAAKAEDNEPALKRIAEERRSQWKLLSGLIKAASKANRTEINESFLSKIGKNSSCPTYQLRSKSVADGLGWGTANAVLDAALQAFKTSFALGRAPRFASGAEIDQDCLFLQFTVAGGVASASLLAGKQADLQLLPSNGCGKRKYGEFKFRLGAAKAHTYATGTWQYHRPLPDGSNIALARLVRRRIGMHDKWAIQLLVKPKTPIRESVDERKPLVAVHFGWAADIAGRRVAAIADASDPGTATILALPLSIEESLGRAREIQGIRDKSRDEIAPQVRSIVVPESANETLIDLLGRVRKTRPQDISANRIHYLCRLLREVDHLPDWLEIWRKEDKLRWQDQAYIAKRARNARKSFYRDVAITLGRQYDAIAIEPLDLASAAVKVDEATGEKTDFAKKARAGRVVAALYEFESAIRWAAAKTAAALIEVSGATASVCSVCYGHVEATKDDHQSIVCHDCGSVLDRKQNGAAIAWQSANDKREEVVADFWSEYFADSKAKKVKKAERLAKMAEGRKRSASPY